MSAVDTTTVPPQEQPTDVLPTDVPVVADDQVVVEAAPVEETAAPSMATIKGFQAFYIPIIALGVLIILFIAWKLWNRSQEKSEQGSFVMPSGSSLPLYNPTPMSPLARGYIDEFRAAM